MSLSPKPDMNHRHLSNILDALGRLFRDPAYLYPIVLAVVILSLTTIYGIRVSKFEPNYFLFIVFGLSILFLVGPFVVRMANLIPEVKILEREQAKVEKDKEKIEQQIQKNKRIRREYEKKKRQHELALTLELVSPEKRPDIWAGFTGAFHAFNAPWVLEMKGDVDTETYVALHRKRYKDRALKMAKYLYVYDENKENDVFWSRFERFVKFEAMVFYRFSKSDVETTSFLEQLEKRISEEEALDPPVNKLATYLLTTESIPLTFFYGNKDHGPMAIFYFNVGPFFKRGLPTKVLKSTNSEFVGRISEFFSDLILQESTQLLMGNQLFRFYIEEIRRRKNAIEG